MPVVEVVAVAPVAVTVRVFVRALPPVAIVAVVPVVDVVVRPVSVMVVLVSVCVVDVCVCAKRADPKSSSTAAIMGAVRMESSSIDAKQASGRQRNFEGLIVPA